MENAARLDELLRSAYRAFNNADYHPWPGIEDEIRLAVASHSPNEKLAVLRQLPKKLAKSDYDSVRALGREIAAIL